MFNNSYLFHNAIIFGWNQEVFFTCDYLGFVNAKTIFIQLYTKIQVTKLNKNKNI